MLRSGFDTPRLHIMVSSTIRGLDAERRAIKDGLENQKIYPNLFKVHLSEDWTSDDRSSKELCIELARECNFFILLLGAHYGNPPQGTPISVTEMEFNAARANDPRKVRAYLKKVQTVEVEAKQQQFIEKVRDFHTGMQCPQFHSLTQLRQFVITDALTYRDSLLSQSSVNSTQLSQAYVPSLETSHRSHRLLETPDGTVPISKESRNKKLVDQQRSYLRNAIRTERPTELAERLVGDLRPEDHRCLAMIAQGNILARREYLEILLPEEKWSSLLRRMSQRGLLTSANGFLKVAENVETFLEKDKGLSKEVHERWVSVLEQKADYSDLALALCCI